MSSPFHDLKEVKCFSIILAPNATDAIAEAFPTEWSLNPTIASLNIFL